MLACLPDGSRALIPAQWTDWDEGHCGGVCGCGETNVGSRALGSLGDLLQLRHLVDALRGRSIGVGIVGTIAFVLTATAALTWLAVDGVGYLPAM